MNTGIDPDDGLSDLPPLPPLGQLEEDSDIDDGDEALEDLDEGDERPGLDLDSEEGPSDALDPSEFVEQGEDSVRWTEGSEEAGDAVEPATLADTGEPEYGLTEGTEAPQDTDLEGGVDVLGEESLVTDDAGEEGIDDVAADLWRDAKDEDDAPGLPPLGREEPASGAQDDLDLGDEVAIDVPTDEPAETGDSDPDSSREG